jgi:hypothetical protein
MITIKGTAVLRDGDEIGTIEGGQCSLSGKVGGIIKGQIRKASGLPDLVFVEGVEAKDSPSEGDERPTTFDDGKKRHGIERLFHMAAFDKLPKPPSTHPGMGKITPVFVEWARQHLAPDEFEREYGQRRLCTIAEFEKAEAKTNDPWRKIVFKDGLTKETNDSDN